MTSIDARSDASDSSDARVVDAGEVDAGSAESDTALVCLSPGHPSEEGDKCYEAIINRKVAYNLRALLLEHGFDVLITTSDLTDRHLFSSGFDNEDESNWDRLAVQSPEEKAEICNDADADYVISIHHNYAYTRDTNHTMVLYGVDDKYAPRHEAAKRWAHMTARRLRQVMKTRSSRAFGDRNRLGYTLEIISKSNAPAILTEASFYSNPKERRRLNRDTYIEREAQAIFKAFRDFYRDVNQQE